jgi:HEAT repeat protein
MTGLEKLLQDKRSVRELLETALAEAELDDDEIGNSTIALAVLHARGTRDVLDAALVLCKSLDSKCRSLGALILGELGIPERVFIEECGEALLELARHDPDPDVQSDAILGLNCTSYPKAEPHLLALRKHPRDDIRRRVALALQGTTSPEVVQGLIEMMEDSDRRVRDWATTSIGETVSIDGPEIREALLKRAADEDELVRVEGQHGLARRGDTCVLPLLLADLASTDNQHPYYFEEIAKTFLGLSEDEKVDAAALVDALNASRH